MGACTFARPVYVCPLACPVHVLPLARSVHECTLACQHCTRCDMSCFELAWGPPSPSVLSSSHCPCQQSAPVALLWMPLQHIHDHSRGLSLPPSHWRPGVQARWPRCCTPSSSWGTWGRTGCWTGTPSCCATRRGAALFFRRFSSLCFLQILSFGSLLLVVWQWQPGPHRHTQVAPAAGAPQHTHQNDSRTLSCTASVVVTVQQTSPAHNDCTPHSAAPPSVPCRRSRLRGRAAPLLTSCLPAATGAWCCCGSGWLSAPGAGPAMALQYRPGRRRVLGGQQGRRWYVGPALLAGLLCSRSASLVES